MSRLRRCGCLFAVALLLPMTATAQPADQELPALHQRVLQLYQAGKYADAIAPARQALQLAERRFDSDHPELVTALYSLAAVYQADGRHAEAEPHLQRALDIVERSRGPDHGDVGPILYSLASAYRAQGRYGEAEPLYKRVLEIRERTLGPEHPDVATVLNSLAELHHEQGRYGAAEPLHTRALAIREKALRPEHPSLRVSVNNLARLYYAQARYAEAEPLLKRLVSLAEAALGTNHPDVAATLSNLAELHQARGQYVEAEPLLRRALAIAEKALGAEHSQVAASLHSLAKLYHLQARYADAEPLYRRALAIWEQALRSEHRNVATALNNLALLQSAQDRFSEAEKLFKRALEITEETLGPHHPEVGASLNNLAEFYRVRNRHGEAEPLYRRALTIEESAFRPDHPRVAIRLNNLALLYAAQLRFADAAPLFRQALAITERALGHDHPEVVTTLNNLAALHFIQGELGAAADQWLQSTQAIVRRVRRGTERVGAALTGKGKNEAERLSFQFWNLIRVVFRLAEAQRTRWSELAEDMFRTAQWAHASEAALSLAQMAARQAKGDGALARLVRERQDLVVEWQAKDKLLIAARSEPPARRQAQGETALAARLAAIDRRVAEIDATLAKDFPNYAALANPEPLGIAEVQVGLGAEEALVLFVDTPEWKPMPAELFLWVITRTESRWVRAGLGNTSLEARFAALRCGLDRAAWDGQGAVRCANLLGPSLDGIPTQNAALPFDLERAHALYQALFSQVADLINAKHLLIVPSGPLTQLPFHVLVTEKPDPRLTGAEAFRRAAWLAKRHAITVLPAVSSLKALREHAKASRATKPFLGFGNPLLDGPDRRYATPAKLAREKQECPSGARRRVAAGFVAGVKTIAQRGGLADAADLRAQIPLPETADELCAVAQNLKAAASDIHLGRRATERGVKALSDGGSLAAYRIIHFATHGALAGELTPGAEPGLILTPPDMATAEDDGYLTASEIAALKLDADWVILSACNTAAGGTQHAEALSGLARAFFYAGARAMLVSHWAVYSDSTVKLITKALGTVGADTAIGRSEALRRSILALIANGDPHEAHPAHWAPFVVVGEGGR
jgi:CHAT domain-containing protein/tetratricopeptide (TPR) repeat protein